MLGCPKSKTPSNQQQRYCDPECRCLLFDAYASLEEGRMAAKRGPNAMHVKYDELYPIAFSDAYVTFYLAGALAIQLLHATHHASACYLSFLLNSHLGPTSGHLCGCLHIGRLGMW
jgi:hypothetical protein